MLISQVGNSVPSAEQPSQGASKPAAEVMTPQISRSTQNSTVQAQNSKPQDSKIKAAVDVANHFMKTLSQNLEFSIDDETKRTVVKVVDTSTNEVIKQFPSQEMLDIARALDRLQGVLHKTKA